MQRSGFFGFGAGRKLILSAIFWVTLVAHVLTYVILLIFFFVSLTRSDVTSIWYLTPFYWLHILSTGVFLTATLDGVQPGILLAKPSVLVTVLMVLSIVLNIIAGYFYIIDLWLPCIFDGLGPNLNAGEQSICDNERLYLWVMWVGSIILLILPISGFIAGLWDSLVQLAKSRRFSALSGAASQFGSGIASFGRGAFGSARERFNNAGAGGDDEFSEPLDQDLQDLDTYRMKSKMNGGRTKPNPVTKYPKRYGSGGVTGNRR